MLIAGPCGIENQEQGFKIAQFVKEYGATHFRGEAFKGQNRPIVNGKPEYLGMGKEGVLLLSRIQKEVGIPCVCDAQSLQQAFYIHEAGIRYIMVGARNMDNLQLLRDISVLYSRDKRKNIILKRGPSATVNEWLGAAEHLDGPSKVILCERGTVHFDRHDYTRYRLDMVGVAEVKKFNPEYKIIVDPSHGSGNRELIYLLTKCALAIADGVMIETHYHPASSPTDAPQTIDFDEFKKVAKLYTR